LGLTGNESAREGVLKVVRTHGVLLEIVGETYSNDLDVVVAAVRNDAKSLQFASPELRGRLEIVQEAVKANGLALQFASSQLQNYPNLVYKAVRQNGEALEFASEELKQHKDIVIAAVTKTPLALRHAAEDMSLDPDIQEELLRAAGNDPPKPVAPAPPPREDSSSSKPKPQAGDKPKLMLCLRWRAIRKNSSSLALEFKSALVEHWYLRKLEVLNPNDMRQTHVMCSLEAVCNGTPDTCLNTKTCWRSAVRKKITEQVNFAALLALEESDGLSLEQSLQLEMAKELGMKVFKVSMSDEVFDGQNMWKLGCSVREWNAGDRLDTRPKNLSISVSPAERSRDH